MKSFLNLVFLALFSFVLVLNGEKQFVYCFHTDKGDIHLEVAHADCSVKKDEVHLKALEDWNLSVDKLEKLVGVFYELLVKDKFKFSLPSPLKVHNLVCFHDPPLSSVKLLI